MDADLYPVSDGGTPDLDADGAGDVDADPFADGDAGRSGSRSDGDQHPYTDPFDGIGLGRRLWSGHRDGDHAGRRPGRVRHGSHCRGLGGLGVCHAQTAIGIIDLSGSGFERGNLPVAG